MAEEASTIEIQDAAERHTDPLSASAGRREKIDLGIIRNDRVRADVSEIVNAARYDIASGNMLGLFHRNSEIINAAIREGYTTATMPDHYRIMLQNINSEAVRLHQISKEVAAEGAPERDKKLYDGAIHETIEERLKRILSDDSQYTN